MVRRLEASPDIHHLRPLREIAGLDDHHRPPLPAQGVIALAGVGLDVCAYSSRLVVNSHRASARSILTSWARLLSKHQRETGRRDEITIGDSASTASHHCLFAP